MRGHYDYSDALTLFLEGNAVQGPNGPRCRSDVSPTPYRGSEFFPAIEGGFLTFRPGDGQCRPAALFNGSNAVSAVAVDFIRAPTTTRVLGAVWLNFFFDPADPTRNDPELGELGWPEFSGVGSINVQRGPFSGGICSGVCG